MMNESSEGAERQPQGSDPDPGSGSGQGIAVSRDDHSGKWHPQNTWPKIHEKVEKERREEGNEEGGIKG
jgi:hypothetical protein